MNDDKATPPSERPMPTQVDPYFQWARATGYVYYGKADWLPVLIELRGTSTLRGTAQAFAELVFKMQSLQADAQSWAAHLRVPRFYASPPPRLKKPTSFIALLARPQFLEDVCVGAAPADSILRFELGRATGSPDHLLWPANVQKAPQWVEGKPGVVITGVIDDGIAFAHDRFLSTDGTTRIEYLRDQQLTGPGSELDKRSPQVGIDQRMADSRYASLVDEDEVYRLSGHVDHARPGHKPIAARVAHGTSVMDLACNAAVRPQAGTRPIIAVQLPSATVEDTSCATLGPQVVLGLCYILERADAVAVHLKTGQLPVVVNLSYGMIAGPHDGSSPLEQAMDELIDSCHPPLRIVLPAGNNHLSRCHARFSLAAGQSQELAWRVLPDDWTESYLELWLPAGADESRVTVTVTAPDRSTIGPVALGSVQPPLAGAPVVCSVTFLAAVATGTRARMRVWLAPTGSPGAVLPLARAGLWCILIANHPQAAALCGIEVWIQRDDTAPGYRRSGRQSYFDDPAYRRFDDGGRAVETDDSAGYVKREGTLNAIATGQRTLVIGGFRRSDGKPVPMSACGPVVAPGRGLPNPEGPDAMLPSDDAPSLRGVLGAGTRSGSCIAMQGTSVAAPQAALRIAERLAANPNLSSDRQFVFDDAAALDPTLPPKPAPKRGGGGRLPPLPTGRPRRDG